MRFLILMICFSGSLHAALQDFPRPAERPALFAAATEPTLNLPHPDDPVDINTGHIGFTIWVNPYLRFAGSPDGELAGVGLEVSYLFGQTFGITIGAAGYAGGVEVETGRRSNSKTIAGGELEMGFRMRMLRWDGGALYLDTRAAYGTYTGGDAVRTTHVIGGGLHFGWEFGGTVIRGFIEGGIDLRAALNHSNSGWMHNGSRNGGLGWHFDLARVGLRIYL